MFINFHNLDNKILQINILESNTIEELKYLILDMTGIQPFQLDLFFNDIELDNSNTLKFYNINNAADIIFKKKKIKYDVSKIQKIIFNDNDIIN
jgi:hypothetical protein